jgi:hypothetical protein
MTAINLRAVFVDVELDDDEPIVDERQCRARSEPLHSGPLRAERPEARQKPDVHRNDKVEVV